MHQPPIENPHHAALPSATTAAGSPSAALPQAAAALRPGATLEVTVLALLESAGGTADGAARSVRLATQFGVLHAVTDIALQVGAAYRTQVADVDPVLRLRVQAPADPAAAAPAAPVGADPAAAVRAVLQAAIAAGEPAAQAVQDAWGEVWRGVLGGGREAGAALARGLALPASADALRVLAAALAGDPAAPTTGERAGDAAGRAPPGAEREPAPPQARAELQRAAAALRATLGERAAEPGQGAERATVRELPLAWATPPAQFDDLRWFVGVARDEVRAGTATRGADEAFVVVVLSELSRLGPVRADLRLHAAAGVDVMLRARSERAAAELRARLPDLRAGLEDCGLCVGGLQARRAVADAELTAGLPQPPSSSHRAAAGSVDCHA